MISIHTRHFAAIKPSTQILPRFLADARKPPVAHGDLSSSNVLVRANGACVLCDFECATVLHSFSGYHRQSDAASLWVSRDITLQNRSSVVGTQAVERKMNRWK